MQIDYIVCPDYIENKLESEHNVTVREARQVLLSKPRIRFAEKGHTEIIISARDMSSKEQKAYGHK
jgi:uncharacterized DUF497 family protein